MPSFSIVIPTRNGASTLRSTLRTVLAADYDDYEVVVCDNDTSDATRVLVDELASERIRYVRAPRPLAMCANWELAVSETRGEYVILLGDDDGLMPFALQQLEQLIQRTHCPLVRWDPAFFLWPKMGLPGQSDYLRLPMRRGLKEVEGGKQIRRVLAFHECYSSLPMLYNSAVARPLLDELRGRAGRVFLSRIPDVSSGFALAYTAGRYLSMQVPLTVSGASAKSTGVGTLFSRTATGDDWHQLNRAQAFTSNAALPDLLVFPSIPVGEAFLAVKGVLFPDDDSLVLDRRALLLSCLGTLRTNSLAEWEHSIACLRGWVAPDAELASLLEKTLATTTPSISGPMSLRSGPAGIDETSVHVETDRFGVQDVADAVQLCVQLLAPSSVGLSIDDSPSRDQTITDIPSSSARETELNRQVQEKETVIQSLARQVHEKETALHGLHSSASALYRQLQDKESALQALTQQLNAKERSLLELHSSSAALQVQLQEKEAALQALHHERSKLPPPGNIGRIKSA